jgi:hypothetical protein
MSKKQSIETLRIFFCTSVAALKLKFEVYPEMVTEKDKDMLSLHEEAKEEAFKEDPDMDKLSHLLIQMEILPQLPNKTKFKKGGYHG